MKVEIVTINDTVNVEVRKLALRDYAELLKALQELPKYINQFSGKSQDEIISLLPELIGTCYPDLVRVLSIATDMTEEQIDEMGLDDLVTVFEAILRLNKYDHIYTVLKKAMTRRNTETVETTQIQ